MSIRTIHLATGLVVAIRSEFVPLLDQSKQQRADEHGQPLWGADAIVAGAIPSGFAVDRPGPAQIRVRTAGARPSMSSGFVRLDGLVKLSKWYQPRGRGMDARSDVVVTGERIEPTSERPNLRAGLPAIVPADSPMTLFGWQGGVADVAFAPSGSYVVEGLAEVRCAVEPGDELFGAEVVPVGLTAFYVQPDSEDVGQRNKAELHLLCARFEAVPSTNGRGRKPEAPAAEPVEVSA